MYSLKVTNNGLIAAVGCAAPACGSTPIFPGKRGLCGEDDGGSTGEEVTALVAVISVAIEHNCESFLAQR